MSLVGFAGRTGQNLSEPALCFRKEAYGRWVEMKQCRNPFDDVAEQYDAWFDSEKGRVIFAQEVDCLRSVMLSATGRWLEIGVGTGRFGAALGVAEGVDPSASMRALAEQRGVRTANAVGESLPYADRSFDGVLMTTTMCFLTDPGESLKECHRVLKDTGCLVVGLIPANSSWGQLYQQIAAQGHPVYSAATFRTSDETVRLAAAAGFQLQQASSCLLAASESLGRAEKPHEGIVADAGFVVMVFIKTSTDERLMR